ncbi:heavy metal translocating P-type ATPase [Hyphomicrobium sp.]|uniref:heavy metal translocating P-type ATPase n=1 Tax=Hyphomicrobium sp. TaxID=82 RepID=UPI001DF711CA|nr:heavy metal translocating P-type ATPase [Hyphomicrobium sp.]MBY0558505.1 heavy metal translocating P-type ATPase [Hyphomicrobium sp.]
MTEKTELDVPLVLPEVTDASDACIRRLIADLDGRSGIEKVHVLGGQGSTPARLCAHYDPSLVSLARIREIIQASGAAITERFGHAFWQVDGIAHERRARTIEKRLQTLPGVLEVEASASGVVRVEFDRMVGSEPAILEALSQMGVGPRKSSRSSLAKSNQANRVQTGVNRSQWEDRHETGEENDHGHSHGGVLGENAELLFSLACGVLLASGYLIGKLSASAPAWLPMVFFLAAYFFGGFFTIREAIDNLRLKRFEIDTLMLVAAAGAAALGAFAEGALLLFLFSLGHALEHYAMGRAKRAIEALAELAPRTATVRRDGDIREISVEELAVGDVVLVRPNERLPADGFLIRGVTSVNQAPVTGESIPVDKRAVDDAATARSRPETVEANSRVFAGTINGGGAIEIEVTRRSSDTALAKVVKMVSEAETQKSPTQRFTDKFERVFVPAVLLLAVVLLFAWVVIDEPFRDSFYRSMAVLVAASPCALAIATPSAVLSGVARAARGGVLIKGGAPLENLGSLNAIAFDKTGTLTAGRPRITDIVTVDGVAKDELLAVAIAVESLSDHPLAAAIARDGRAALGNRNLTPANDLQSLTGRGVKAMLAGDPVWIGKAEMFGSEGIPALSKEVAEAIERLRQSGRTTMAVRRADRDLGAIGLMDTPRTGAREALDRLRSLGITRLIMISGDHGKVAEAIAREVGLDEAWGDLMPEDKVKAIQKLRQEAKVAMVGDGVNDAPAMANATVGIAMGAAGSDVALETADVALMADDLTHLPFAVGLSRRTRKVILQNVFISLGMVGLLVPSTILGLGIGEAVAMHEGSTLVVVLNALRLLAYRDRTVGVPI